jgi:hypothetical protein
LKFVIWQLERLTIIILSLKDTSTRDHIYNKLLEFLDNYIWGGVFVIFLRLKFNEEETEVVIEKLENLIKLLGDKIARFSLRKLYLVGAEIAKKSDELDKVHNFKILEAKNFIEEANNRKEGLIKADFLRKQFYCIKVFQTKKIELTN